MSCYGWQDLFGFAGANGQLQPGQCSYFEGSTVLPQVVGWVVVVAFGGGKLGQCPAGLRAIVRMQQPGLSHLHTLLAADMDTKPNSTWLLLRACSVLGPHLHRALG